MIPYGLRIKTTHKVLITGITGFVGPYLARELLESGNEVTGLLRRNSAGQRPNSLREIGVHLVYADITDLTSVLSAIEDTRPEWIFHLAAQSYVPQSFKDPLGTFRINCLGTQNILEAVRLKDLECRIIFAGSSEEYGLQFLDFTHFESMKKKYGVIEPMPESFPELPISEEGVLRPMSPYATSKVYGDYAFRNYHNTFGLDTVVSRGFNHEGAGRGHSFVTSSIVRQLVLVHLEQQDVLRIGDIQIFRDWSHVKDIIDGYIRLAEGADAGSVYVQGSKRTNSVLSYMLNAISVLGYKIFRIHSAKGDKTIKDPLDTAEIRIGKIVLDSNTADRMLMSREIEYNLGDEGLIIETDKRNFKVQFDPLKFRPSEVPVLLSNIDRMKGLGFLPKKKLIDIAKDQINYYLDPDHRKDLIVE